MSTSRIITIDAIILYNYDMDLSDYDEIYLPNCIEIIDSFKNVNNTIKRIVAPNLISIDCSYGFDFPKLESLVVPKIRYLASSKITEYFVGGYNLNIETSSKFSTLYWIPNHYGPETNNMEIYKDIDACFVDHTFDNKFYNCTIYNDFGRSTCSCCNIQLSALEVGKKNIFYKCRIPHLGIIVDRNKYVNEIRINALKTSKFYQYLKSVNDEDLTDEEIIDILQSKCKCNDIRNIKVSTLEDIAKNEDVIYDLEYLLCTDILDAIQYRKY